MKLLNVNEVCLPVSLSVISLRLRSYVDSQFVGAVARLLQPVPVLQLIQQSTRAQASIRSAAWGQKTKTRRELNSLYSPKCEAQQQGKDVSFFQP